MLTKKEHDEVNRQWDEYMREILKPENDKILQKIHGPTKHEIEETEIEHALQDKSWHETPKRIRR